MWGEVWTERREGVGRRRRKRHPRGRPRLEAVGGQGTRGAHVPHAVHVRDLGGVKAQRLVQLLRALPAEARSMRYGARCGRGGGG